MSFFNPYQIQGSGGGGGSVIINSLYKTVGIGGDYPTIAAAFLDGAFYLQFISDVTEVTDFVNSSGTTVDIFLQNPKGYVVNCDTYSPFYASGNTTLNFVIDSLQLTYSYSSTRSLFKAQSAGTVINVRSYGTSITNTSDPTVESWAFDEGLGTLNLSSINDVISIPITVLAQDTVGGYNITKGSFVNLNATGNFNLGSGNFNAIITVSNSSFSGQLFVYSSFIKILTSYFGVSGGVSTIIISNTCTSATCIGNTTGVPIVDNGTATELVSNTLY